MGRETTFPTYFLHRDDCHRLDDFFEEVVQNSLAKQIRRPPLAFT